MEDEEKTTSQQEAKSNSGVSEELEKLDRAFESHVPYPGINVDLKDIRVPRGYELEVITNAKGGKQHKIDGRFDLVPSFAQERVAQILENGAKRYGDNNWMSIPMIEHLNHVAFHIVKHLQGDTSEDHLGNMTCRAMFALDLAVREKLENPWANEPPAPGEEILHEQVEAHKPK